MTVEPEEILPVISLSEGSEDAVYNDEGEVLLLTWHRFPDSYPQGEEVSIRMGDGLDIFPGGDPELVR